MKKFALAANFALAAIAASASHHKDCAQLAFLALTTMDSFSLDGNFFTLSDQGCNREPQAEDSRAAVLLSAVLRHAERGLFAEAHGGLLRGGARIDACRLAPVA